MPSPEALMAVTHLLYLTKRIEHRGTVLCLAPSSLKMAGEVDTTGIPLSGSEASNEEYPAMYDAIIHICNMHIICFRAAEIND